MAETPQDVSQGFAAAITRGDIEAAAGFWAPDGVITAPDGTRTEGTAQLRERFAGLIAAGAALEIAVSDVRPLSGGAVARTTMTMTLPGSNGGVALTTTAEVTYVRGADGLKIARDAIGAAG